VVIEDWRKEYNELRPHSALGYAPPSVFKTFEKLVFCHSGRRAGNGQHYLYEGKTAPPSAPLIEGGRGEKMPDPRIQCGAGKSCMTNAKKKVFRSSLFSMRPNAPITQPIPRTDAGFSAPSGDAV